MNGMAWSSEENRLLREAIEDGGTAEEVANEVGRTKKSVQMKMFKLGIKGVHRGKLNPDMRSKILSLLGDGIRPPMIAKHLGVVRSAVTHVIKRLYQDGLLDRHAEGGRVVYTPSRRWVYESEQE